MEQLPEVAAAKKRNGGKEVDVKVSTTDPDAHVMKRGDGGFRPAVNVQRADHRRHGMDMDMDMDMAVVNAGSDMAQLGAIVEQVEQHPGQAPGQWLVDGGFPSHEQIDATARKTAVYAPVPKPMAQQDTQGKTVQQDKHEPQPGDSPAVAE